MLDDALGYAAVGLRVFPCHSIENGRCSCRRDGCPSPGKHPRTLTGSKSATTDEKQIREWWTMWPSANIAIATGDGIFALDVDRRPDKDGTLWLEALRHELPPTAEQVTPSGGRHLLYRHPPHLRVSNSTDALCRGVDVRGEGGYIMAEPSNHLLGVYVWEDDPRDR